MVFEMTNFKDGKVYGALTMRGKTKDVVLTVEISKIIANPFDKSGKTVKQGISLSTKINRLDFGVGTSFAAKTVGNEVKIVIELEGDATK